MNNKRDKTALDRSFEFKEVIVQIVVEIQFESAWALTNINLGMFFMPNGPQEARGSEEEDFTFFPVYFYGSNPGHSEEDPYWTLGLLSE